jgi:hypothetical protein
MIRFGIFLAALLAAGLLSAQTNFIAPDQAPVWFDDVGAFGCSVVEPGRWLGQTTGMVTVIWQESNDLRQTWEDRETNACAALGSQVLYAVRTNGSAFFRAKVMAP